MKGLGIRWHVAAALLSLAPASSAQLWFGTNRPPGEAAFEGAQEAAREGKTREAFRQYLALPGAEHCALALVRTNAGPALDWIEQDSAVLKTAAGRLLKADLLLVTGHAEEAKALYHELTSLDPTRGWTREFRRYYPVEPPPSTTAERTHWRQAPADFWEELTPWPLSGRRLAPFLIGPGSQRDNWLLRRLTALEMTDDAAREFARLWDIHRENTRPYISETREWVPGTGLKATKRVFRPVGFNGQGLQFATDYAFFLERRRSDTNAALAVLWEAMQAMDMDVNPNLPLTEPWDEAAGRLYPERPDAPFGSVRDWAYASRGIPRKEFIRLAYGDFKTSGRESQLEGRLEESIARGANRLRRVLAQVRLCQQQPDAALALELEYLDHAGLPAFDTAYRRGGLYETFRKLAEAVEQYEQALNLPATTVRLADGDETPPPNPWSSAPLSPPRRWPPANAGFLRVQLRQSLERLYAALGQMDRALDMVLNRFETEDKLLQDEAAVAAALTRFEAAKQKARFCTWASPRAHAIALPLARAAILWQLGETNEAVAAVFEAARTNRVDFSTATAWKARLVEQGPDNWRRLIQTLVEVRPQDPDIRQEWLAVEGRFGGADEIAWLELSLARQPPDLIVKTCRLMRLYEKFGELDKLRALGLKLARLETPFNQPSRDPFFNYGGNGHDEMAEACLALAIQYGDSPAYLDSLGQALKDKPWSGAPAQLERRRASQPFPPPAAPVPWANVPDGVELFVSDENVLCLAGDEQHVFSGHSWGIGVRDLAGRPILRVAVAGPIREMARLKDDLWAASDDGLVRINVKTWAVARLPLGGERGQCLLASKGQVWVGTYGDIRCYEPETGLVRLYSRAVLGGAFEWTDLAVDELGLRARGNYGRYRYNAAEDSWSAIPGTNTPPAPKNILRLPTGTLVQGESTSWLEHLPVYQGCDWPGFEPGDGGGGLFFTEGNQPPRRVSAERAANRLHADGVYSLTFDPGHNQVWLCTTRGVALLDEQRRVIGSFSKADGLIADRVQGAAVLGDLVYFAAGCALTGGGLIAFDPRTRVFTTFTRADGMDSDKVEGVAVEGDRLAVRYAPEGSYRQSPPGFFEPKDRRFISGGAPVQRRQQDLLLKVANAHYEAMPWLGGWILTRDEHDGRTWLCGTRGLMVFPGTNAPVQAVAMLPALEIPDLEARLSAEAERTPIPNPISAPQLRELLAHTNPHVRVKALLAAVEPVAARPSDYLELLLPLATNPVPAVRLEGVRLLAATRAPEALPALRVAFQRGDPNVRGLAAPVLLRSGDMLALEYYEPHLPGHDAYELLAACANPQILALAARHPPCVNDDWEGVLEKFGKALREHPDYTGALLTAEERNIKRGWPLNNFPLNDFLAALFRHAGAPVLPVLHQALTSTNRVVRSNAARACGAVGDPGSIPRLLAALDLESGLSRASIVWALGELKAREAVPKLRELYAQAREDRPEPDGLGFLHLQNVGAQEAGLAQAIQQVNSLAAGAHDPPLPTAGLFSKPATPEVRLTTGLILEAIRKIGPANAQEFYRALAGSPGPDERSEAALNLAQAAPAEREGALAALRSLSGDPDLGVQTRARVSLVLLGDLGMQASLRELLRSTDDDRRSLALDELARLGSAQLEFARPEIEAIAENSKEPLYLENRAQALSAKMGRGAKAP